MAHYAFLDEDNIVVEVIVGIDETELIDGLAPEIWYGNFRNQKCVRTSYNGNIRANYAGIGFFYDEINDVFIPPKPYESWILDETYKWKAPVDIPADSWSDENQTGTVYFWDDMASQWSAVN